MKIINLIISANHFGTFYEFHLLFGIGIFKCQLHRKTVRRPSAQFIVLFGQNFK